MTGALLCSTCVVVGILLGAWRTRPLRRRIAHLEANEKAARECMRSAMAASSEAHLKLWESQCTVRQLLEERKVYAGEAERWMVN